MGNWLPTGPRQTEFHCNRSGMRLLRFSARSAAATRAAPMGQHEPEALERRAVQRCRQQQVAFEPAAGVAAPAAVEVACRDAVGGQNCGRRWAGGKCGMYILSGGYG